MKILIAGCILIIGSVGYAMWYNTPIKKEQFNVSEHTVLNAQCSWDEPYMVPTFQTVNGVTSMSLQTYYNTYYGHQNQVVRYWAERNTYRSGKVKVTQEAQVIEQLSTCQ